MQNIMDQVIKETIKWRSDISNNDKTNHIINKYFKFKVYDSVRSLWKPLFYIIFVSYHMKECTLLIYSLMFKKSTSHWVPLIKCQPAKILIWFKIIINQKTKRIITRFFFKQHYCNCRPKFSKILSSHVVATKKS